MKTIRLHIRFRIIVRLIVLVFILSHTQMMAQRCCSDPKTTYYYNYSNSTLYLDIEGKNLVSRPIEYKANKDIQIHIYNFNPLREEISVENTYSEWFLGDSARFYSYILLPNATGLANMEKPKEAKQGDENNIKGSGEQNKINLCEEVNIYRDEYNILLIDSKEIISHYSEYLSATELIYDDYNYLKSLHYISKESVTNTLTNNFLFRYNNSINTFDFQKVDLISVSSNIVKYEDEIYKKVTEKKRDVLDFQQRMMTNLEPGECIEGYNDLVKQLNILIQDFSELDKNRIDKVIPGLSKVKAIYDRLLYYAFNDPSFITPALTIDKDFHTISIYSKKLDNQEKVLIDKINIEPKCGFKIDFSMGLFVSGLYDQQFTLKSKDSIYSQVYISADTIADSLASGTFKAIYEKDNIPVSFGAMLFLHAHSQHPGIFNYGFSLGFGSLFNDQARLTYAAGLSGILGRKQRLVITVGVALSQVDRLGVPYLTETWYLENIDNVPIDRVWKINWMTGVTWNLK